MNCVHRDRIHDYLDGLLGAEEEAEFRAHLSECEDCPLELVAMERVFAEVERALMFDPGEAFTERVLDDVVPARLRRRWIAAFGWSYAAALIPCIAVGGLVAFHPGIRAFAAALLETLSRGALQNFVLGINGLGYLALRFAQAFAFAQGAFDRLSPLVRAVQSLLSIPTVALTLAIAVASCAVLLRWMRARDQRIRGEVPHVGIFAF